MSTQGTFFDELKDWSGIKLRIIEKYLDAYMNKRGSSNSTIYYIDGFAGAGYYGTNELIQGEGSPIRAAKLAQRIVDSGKPNRLICLFVEENRDRYRELSTALSAFDPAVVRSYPGTFQKHLPTILSTIGRDPAVFFLDPFGVKHVTMADTMPILQRRDTEVLINFNTPRLRQLAGFEDSKSPEAQAKVALVSRVLGEDPSNSLPMWLQEWYRLGKNGIQWEQWAVSAYANRLVQSSPELRYGLIYGVRASFVANPKYYLVFATRSKHAIPFMNDFLCTEDDDLFAKISPRGSIAQLGFFDTIRESERNQHLLNLLDEIHAYGIAHPGCNREDLMHHFMMIHFGRFKQKHYRDAVDRLIEAGRAKFEQGPRATTPITFS